MAVRQLNTKSSGELNPGDKISVFDEWFLVRYITYAQHHSKLTLHLQPEDEPLSPFYENDRVVITLPNDMDVDFEVRKC